MYGIIINYEKNSIEFLEYGKSYLYKFSSEEVKNYGIHSFEDIHSGKTLTGIIPTVVCKNNKVESGYRFPILDQIINNNKFTSLKLISEFERIK